MNNIIRYFRMTIWSILAFSIFMVFYNWCPENHLTYVGDIIPGTVEKTNIWATWGLTSDTLRYDSFSFDWRPKNSPSEIRHEPMVTKNNATVWKTSNDWKSYRAPGPYVFPQDATDGSFDGMEPKYQQRKWEYFKQGKVYTLKWYNMPRFWLAITWIMCIFCWVFGTNQAFTMCYRGCPVGAFCCACRSHLNTDAEFYQGKLFYFVRYMGFLGYKKSELLTFINWVDRNNVRVPLTPKTFDAYVAAGGLDGKELKYEGGKFTRVRKDEQTVSAS